MVINNIINNTKNNITTILSTNNNYLYYDLIKLAINLAFSFLVVSPFSKRVIIE